MKNYKMSILEAKSLIKAYNGRIAVNGFSCYVKTGEAVGILGPNGAGKTTSFYMLSGLIKCDKGQILLDNYDISFYPMYKRARLGIGYLPQESSIFRGLTVEQNVKAVLETVEPNKALHKHLTYELLNELKIDHLAKIYATALSGGERRRLEIARALAAKPNIILFDEPFAGVDPLAVGEIKELVQHLRSRNIGVFITDHNVRETLSMVDRAYIMHQGEELAHGKPEELINNSDVKKFYLGSGFKL